MRATLCVCVCVQSRGWWGWRRQHPGRTFGTEFPAALAVLLLSLHKSLPAGSALLLPGDSRFFPKAMPKLAPTPSPCQMTPSSATASPYLSFPRAVVLVSTSPPASVCHPAVLSRCSLLAASAAPRPDGVPASPASLTRGGAEESATCKTHANERGNFTKRAQTARDRESDATLARGNN